MSEQIRLRIMQEFSRRFGGPAEFVARAPGRVNLIGEHTDYNDGFVLPMAIDRAVWIAFRRRNDARVVVHSLDFDQTADFSLANWPKHARGWEEYVRGVASIMNEQNDFRSRDAGWEGVMAGDVPLGAGLSSSAAVELATARVFATAAELPWTPARMAVIAQRAEREWVGVNCGIMDQLISAAGIASHALLIDCRSLETRPVTVPDHTAVVILDTATRRGLVESAYNERRAQCDEAARTLGVSALRDVDLATVARRERELDPVVRKRARHVISENGRTLEAADALLADNVRRAGELMNASHASLRDDFEVSRQELDVMVEFAQTHEACYGARMTGAGFGGCAVALVRRDAASTFATDTARQYEAATGLKPAVYVCAAADGATVDPA